MTFLSIAVSGLVSCSGAADTRDYSKEVRSDFLERCLTSPATTVLTGDVCECVLELLEERYAEKEFAKDSDDLMDEAFGVCQLVASN